MNKKGKGPSKGGNAKDLTRYFVPLSSGNNSKPISTQESENVMDIVVHQEKEQEVEKETENSAATEQVEEDNGDSRDAEQVEEDNVNENENVDVQGDEGIHYFGLDEIKFDPGLRIPIDQFHPNIRDDVKFAYLEKGPTQPTSHNFPKDKDARSFRPHWYKEFNWLEYSVEKDRAYCFYCYLFNERVDEKFGYDVFTKLGYDYWKNVLAAFRKHVGGACSIHNNSRTACVDFQNQSQV